MLHAPYSILCTLYSVLYALYSTLSQLQCAQEVLDQSESKQSEPHQSELKTLVSVAPRLSTNLTVDDREILHDFIHIYIYTRMYYTSRIPLLLVYKVYSRSCRISTINSRGLENWQYSRPIFFFWRFPEHKLGAPCCWCPYTKSMFVTSNS